MPRSSHHSISFQYSLFPKEQRWLFLGNLFRSITQQLAGFFVPVFLFTRSTTILTLFDGWTKGMLESQGWIGEMQRGVLVIAAYYFVYRLIAFFLSIPLSRITKVVGLSSSMILANVVLMLFYLCLAFFDRWNFLIFFVPLLAAIEIQLYWPPYFTQFVVHCKMEKIGQEIGAMEFLLKLARVLLPMVGGIIATYLGFQALHTIASASIFVGSVYLLNVKQLKFSLSVQFDSFIQWLRQKKNWNMQLGFFGKYIDDATFELWTIYTFLFLGSIERLGYVYTLVLFLSLSLTYFMGWYLGKHKGRGIFYLSGGLLSVLWLARIAIQSVWHLITVDLLDRLALSAYLPIFDMQFLQTARNSHVFHFFVFREMLLSLYGMMFWGTVGVLFLLPFQWTGLFILAGAGSMLSLRMFREERR